MHNAKDFRELVVSAFREINRTEVEDKVKAGARTAIDVNNLLLRLFNVAANRVNILSHFVDAPIKVTGMCASLFLRL